MITLTVLLLDEHKFFELPGVWRVLLLVQPDATTLEKVKSHHRIRALLGLSTAELFLHSGSLLSRDSTLGDSKSTDSHKFVCGIAAASL